MTKTATKFCFALYVFVSITFVTSKNVLAQIPTPYVTCGQTDDKEWHSLRPYQASPCKIPINMDEQALICGNDLIVNDKIYIPQDDHEILCNPGCGECIDDCKIRVGGYAYPNRHFQIYFDAYESELPIAGNTELVKGDDSVISSIAKEVRLKDFTKPPQIEQFKDSQDYYLAYQRWRGNGCVNVKIPLIDKQVALCAQNPLSPDFWSNLYPKIPYSSTEDRIGKARVTDMIWDRDKSTVDRVFTPEREGVPDTQWQPHDPAYGKDPNVKGDGDKYGETALYFPHMEENVEMTNILQSTYLPKELSGTAQTNINVEPSPAPNEECKIVNIRKNPGDQLFGERNGSNQGIPIADVYYKAEFRCRVCRTPDPYCALQYGCEKNAWFHSDVSTYTPMIDELFTKTVAGNASVVQKVFPKLGPDTPIEKIKDIPASTAVTHASIDKKISHVETISSPAEFYIPHFGSIYDYLLQDMQTALRPYGFEAHALGLTKSNVISENNLVNEYLSWYLNGTLYRAEQNPLDVRVNTLERILLGKMDDSDRIVNFTGPVNKLLSQNSQWYLMYGQATGSSTQNSGKTYQTQVAGKSKQRHDQIAGCIAGVTINVPKIIAIIIDKDSFTIGGFPVACKTESQKNLPSGGSGASPSPSGAPSGTCPTVADSEIPAAYLNMKPNFISIADRLLPPYTGPDNNLAEECYNYVVKTSLSKGVNAGFSLAIWLHESGASNYAYGGSTTKDMGINDSSIYQNLVSQLDRFLLLPFGSQDKDCAYDTSQGWPTPMHGFLCRFANSAVGPGSSTPNPAWIGCKKESPYCDPASPTSFYNLMTPYFNWVTGCASLPNYPTDMSCPTY